MIQFTETGNGITFGIRVQPRAARSGLAGEMDGLLKIRLAAPPVDGAANAELIRWLAGFFKVSRQQVTLVAGATAKKKIVRIAGLSAAEAVAKIDAMKGKG